MFLEKILKVRQCILAFVYSSQLGTCYGPSVKNSSLSIHERILNVEISFATISLFIKNNILNVFIFRKLVECNI